MQDGYGVADSNGMKHRGSSQWISKGQFAYHLLTLLMVAGGVANAESNPGVIRGAIVLVEPDGSRSMIPGATVVLQGAEAVRQATADGVGSYSFTDLPAGRYQIRASAPGLVGLASAEIQASQSLDVEIPMTIENVKLSVTVNGNVAPAISAEPEQRTEIERSTILNAPTKDDRADTLLPLIPGVVRGPDGLINMKGARSSQAGALVNSASVVDPVTGNPAMSLPIDVVESATVIANPYDPEYGRLTGAVSKTETTTSNFDDFHFSMQNLLPRPRNRDGDFVGIESATPRATITGPIVKDKVAFTESFEYRFVRTPVNSLPPLERDMKFEGVTSFSQVDVNLTSRQSMTATFNLYPHVFPIQPANLAAFAPGGHPYPATDIFAPIGSKFVAVTNGVIDEVSYVDDYSPATKTVTIDVTAAAGTIKLAAVSQLTRDPATKEVLVQITVTNNGTATAAGVQVTMARIGWSTASGLPVSIGSIAAGKSATATIRFPSSVGDAGGHHTLTVSCVYTGGDFEERARVTLP